jgi:uncharacterized membrane protein (UPF0127 family)
MKQKLSVYNLAIIVILLLIILIGSLMLFVNPNRKPARKPAITANEQPALPAKPVFRKDGELRFLDAKTSQVISAIDVEVAATDASREQGLMYRDTMAENTGMLFLMGTEEMQSFWMKNTIISLDIIYVDSERRIVSIHKNCTPYSLDQIHSAAPALYVVEVVAGYTDKYKIEAGDRVSF